MLGAKQVVGTMGKAQLDKSMDVQEAEEPGLGSQLDFPIVGIGASAGGLEAVTTMFQGVETGTGMAFVLVMHLDPDHESMMAELLSSKTRIRVRQIAENDHVEVDCLHVIPPGASLRIQDGMFRLDPFSEPRGLRRPIDSFFTELAKLQGERAAAVVLSGTGGDGTAGMRIIKEFGGISAVQSPEEARYDGMPFSALATKMVDFTLPASEIVPRIRAFFDGAFETPFPDDDDAGVKAMDTICGILKSTTGADFTGYKRSTLLRRLNRRLQVLEAASIEEYLTLLREDGSEQRALARDFLINVTSFFRDREIFEQVRQTVILPLLRNKDASDEVRIWVAGCSSGQEAYSIAMMIDHTCEELKKRPLVQIFATDMDEAMIDIARQASYPVSMFHELPAKYRDAYTVGQDEKFEIIAKIREMVRFSVHDLIQDPPFSKVDMISCRNLMIYLGEELQSGLFPLMHFSLRPGGHLLLGTSESVTRGDNLFIPQDQRARIFRRNDSAKRPHFNLPLGNPLTAKKAKQAYPGSQRMSQEMDFPRHQGFDASNAAIYENYAPPFLRVAQDGRIMDSSGDLSLFMMSRPGEERRLDLLARDGLNEVIGPLLAGATNSGERRAMKGVEVSSPFGVQKTDIIAHPMKDQTVALVFIVRERLQPVIDEFELRPPSRDEQVADLQENLQAARLTLKGKVEEIETANEELKSSNEEMMSMNEELQSANEELTTANEELKNKIDELTLANADLDNLLQSADLAMIVLDRNKRIRHVTDAARKLMPLMRSDEGRSLAEFNIPIGNFNLLDEIGNVIESGEAFVETTEPNDKDQSFYLRITPYFFADGSVEGATLSLIDISKEVELRHDLSVETEKLQLAMKAAGMGSWDTDLETGRMRIDAAAAKIGGLDKHGLVERDAFFKNIEAVDKREFVKTRDAALKKGESYSYTAKVKNSGVETRWVQVHAKPYTGADGRKKVIGLGIDVSELYRLQEGLREESSKLRLALNTARMGVAEMDVETRVTTADKALAHQLNLPSIGEYGPEELVEFIVAEDVPLIDENLAKAVEYGQEYEFDFRVDVPGEDMRYLRSRGFIFTGADGRPKVVAPTVDVTAGEQQKMLVGEMSHRIKNLFAVIAGLVSTAPKDHPETKAMAQDLLERIVSLGKVYDLARKDTTAFGLSLRDMFTSVIGSHASTQALSFDGPDVFISQNVLNTFTLIVHELTTNAAKYGGLSAADGALSVSWKKQKDGVTQIIWEEMVPDFDPPESHEGFGSLLIASGVRQLRGHFDRSFSKKGVRIELSLALSQAEGR
ncbi:MAG: CheR family methyltransferase [Marinomonas sp.]